MRIEWIVAAALSVAFVGCERSDDQTRDSSRDDVEETTNMRGQEDSEMMAEPESDADRAISLNIRKSIAADNSLSANSKNLKISTRNGIVTLMGVVDSVQSKNSIESRAKAVSGVKRVDNRIEVIPNVIPNVDLDKRESSRG